MSETNKRFCIIYIEEQNGEQQYRQRMVYEMKKGQHLKSLAEQVAKTWYDDLDYKEDDRYYFNGGAIAARVDGYAFITESEYNVLNNFL